MIIRYNKQLLLTCLVSAGGMYYGANAAAITVLNANFDPPTENTADNNVNGYGPITSWTSSNVAGSGVNQASQPFLEQPAHSGTHVAFIQNGGNISQSISGYDPTKLYTVTYWVSQRAAASTGTSVSLNGGTTSFTDPDLIIKTDKFRRIVSGPLAVSAATSTLRITAIDGVGDDSLLIDTVSITRAVPVVLDGGFENPVQPNTNGSTRYELANGVGGGTLAGSAWTFVGAHGVTRNASDYTPPAAPEGMQAAMIRSNDLFSQTISGFEAGVTYSLSFEAAGRTGTPNDFQVLLGGNLLTFGASTTISPAGNATYQTYTSNNFTTTGGSFLLVFDGLIGGDRTTFLDDVRFNFVAEAVPEPSSLALLGLSGLLVARRRRG